MWVADGFHPHEQREFERALEQLLLSHRGKYRPENSADYPPNIIVVPRDHEPCAIAWYKRIEQNLRAAGGHPAVTLYMLKDGALRTGIKRGAFLVRDFDMERKW